MNLIDFHVTEIISEEYDKVFKLYGMTEEQTNDKDDTWKNFLLGDGVKQTYEYWDDGGKNTGTKVFSLSQGQVQYYTGYVGQH